MIHEFTDDVPLYPHHHDLRAEWCRHIVATHAHHVDEDFEDRQQQHRVEIDIVRTQGLGSGDQRLTRRGLLIAGRQSIHGQAEREIMATGFPVGAIQKEHRGSTVRRVQCVHCKGITENVATDPFRCSHCGLNLFVRDHYSRRIAAFQGVNIDAEDPGKLPPPVVRFG